MLKRNKKTREIRGFFVCTRQLKLVVATHQAHQQLQQACEQVVDAHVQTQGCHDVVSFATVHNAAYVIQHKACKQ